MCTSLYLTGNQAAAVDNVAENVVYEITAYEEETVEGTTDNVRETASAENATDEMTTDNVREAVAVAAEVSDLIRAVNTQLISRHHAVITAQNNMLHAEVLRLEARITSMNAQIASNNDALAKIDAHLRDTKE